MTAPETPEIQPRYSDTLALPSVGELEVWARAQGSSDYWRGFHDAILVISVQKRLEDCGG